MTTFKFPWMEKFCLLLAGGMTQKDAYREAKGRGASLKADTQAASRVAQRLDVQERIREIRNEYAAQLNPIQIKKLEARIQQSQERWKRMHWVIEARAKAPEFQQAPGGSTGLLVRKLNSLRDGEKNVVVETFEVDTGLLREIRGLEMDVARQLGQDGVVKHELSGPGGGPINLTVTDARLKNLSDEELEQLITLVRKLGGDGDPEPECSSGGTVDPETE